MFLSGLKVLVYDSASNAELCLFSGSQQHDWVFPLASANVIETWYTDFFIELFPQNFEQTIIYIISIHPLLGADESVGN